MGFWPCGTIACLGGHGVIRAGLATAIGHGIVQRAAADELIGQRRPDLSVTGFAGLTAMLFGPEGDVEAMALVDGGNALRRRWDLAQRYTRRSGDVARGA